MDKDKERRRRAQNALRAKLGMPPLPEAAPDKPGVTDFLLAKPRTAVATVRDIADLYTTPIRGWPGVAKLGIALLQGGPRATEVRAPFTNMIEPYAPDTFGMRGVGQTVSPEAKHFVSDLIAGFITDPFFTPGAGMLLRKGGEVAAAGAAKVAETSVAKAATKLAPEAKMAIDDVIKAALRGDKPEKAVKAAALRQQKVTSLADQAGAPRAVEDILPLTPGEAATPFYTGPFGDPSFRPQTPEEILGSPLIDLDAPIPAKGKAPKIKKVKGTTKSVPKGPPRVEPDVAKTKVQVEVDKVPTLQATVQDAIDGTLTREQAEQAAKGVPIPATKSFAEPEANVADLEAAVADHVQKVTAAKRALLPESPFQVIEGGPERPVYTPDPARQRYEDLLNSNGGLGKPYPPDVTRDMLYEAGRAAGDSDDIIESLIKIRLTPPYKGAMATDEFGRTVPAATPPVTVIPRGEPMMGARVLKPSEVPDVPMGARQKKVFETNMEKLNAASPEPLPSPIPEPISPASPTGNIVDDIELPKLGSMNMATTTKYLELPKKKTLTPEQLRLKTRGDHIAASRRYSDKLNSGMPFKQAATELWQELDDISRANGQPLIPRGPKAPVQAEPLPSPIPETPVSRSGTLEELSQTPEGVESVYQSLINGEFGRRSRAANAVVAQLGTKLTPEQLVNLAKGGIVSPRQQKAILARYGAQEAAKIMTHPANLVTEEAAARGIPTDVTTITDDPSLLRTTPPTEEELARMEIERIKASRVAASASEGMSNEDLIARREMLEIQAERHRKLGIPLPADQEAALRELRKEAAIRGVDELMVPQESTPALRPRTRAARTAETPAKAGRPKKEAKETIEETPAAEAEVPAEDVTFKTAFRGELDPRNVDKAIVEGKFTPEQALMLIKNKRVSNVFLRSFDELSGRGLAPEEVLERLKPKKELSVGIPLPAKAQTLILKGAGDVVKTFGYMFHPWFMNTKGELIKEFVIAQRRGATLAGQHFTAMKLAGTPLSGDEMLEVVERIEKSINRAYYPQFEQAIKEADAAGEWYSARGLRLYVNELRRPTAIPVALGNAMRAMYDSALGLAIDSGLKNAIASAELFVDEPMAAIQRVMDFMAHPSEIPKQTTGTAFSKGLVQTGFDPTMTGSLMVPSDEGVGVMLRDAAKLLATSVTPGTASFKNFGRSLSKLVESPMSVTEAFNRGLAYNVYIQKMANEMGMSFEEMIAYAARNPDVFDRGAYFFNLRLNGGYDKFTRPPGFYSPTGRALGMFLRFPANYVEKLMTFGIEDTQRFMGALKKGDVATLARTPIDSRFFRWMVFTGAITGPPGLLLFEDKIRKATEAVGLDEGLAKKAGVDLSQSLGARASLGGAFRSAIQEGEPPFYPIQVMNDIFKAAGQIPSKGVGPLEKELERKFLKGGRFLQKAAQVGHELDEGTPLVGSDIKGLIPQLMGDEGSMSRATETVEEAYSSLNKAEKEIVQAEFKANRIDPKTVLKEANKATVGQESKYLMGLGPPERTNLFEARRIIEEVRMNFTGFRAEAFEPWREAYNRGASVSELRELRRAAERKITAEFNLKRMYRVDDSYLENIRKESPKTKPGELR